MEAVRGSIGKIIAEHPNRKSSNFEFVRSSSPFKFHRNSCENSNWIQSPKPFVNLSLSNSTVLPAFRSSHFSKSQVELGVEKAVKVKFGVQKECEYGEQFLMVGDDELLGSWDPLHAIPLSWSDGHLWSLVLEIPVDEWIQYKFILKNNTGDVLWQPGPDRIFRPWETHHVITVIEDWDDAKEQRIIDEPSTDYSNDELIDNSFIEPKISAFHMRSPEKSLISNMRELEITTLDKELVFDKSSKESPLIRVGQNEKISTEQEEEGSLIIIDEGPVLVPGLTIPFTVSDEVSQLGVDVPKNDETPETPF